MCFACEQEDLYFLYLERLEQARRAAFGEQRAPNPNWMWSGAPAPEVAPAPAQRAAFGEKPAPNANWMWSGTPAAAAAPAPRVTPKSAFVCDTPE